MATRGGVDRKRRSPCHFQAVVQPAGRQSECRGAPRNAEESKKKPSQETKGRRCAIKVAVGGASHPQWNGKRGPGGAQVGVASRQVIRKPAGQLFLCPFKGTERLVKAAVSAAGGLNKLPLEINQGALMVQRSPALFHPPLFFSFHTRLLLCGRSSQR